MVLNNRLEEEVDEELQKTQFGFRKGKGTADAIQCIRRIIDKGESTGTKTLLVLLDWEKAFDKVKHGAIRSALKRYGVSRDLTEMIMALYEKPTFFVEQNGIASDYKPQSAGIRQGCPLSPYLFVIIMSVLFEDVKGRHELNTEADRIKGADFDEILFADDTICVSQDEETMNRLLGAIVEEGGRVGLQLNLGKCEMLAFGKDIGDVQLPEGTN